ncbi:hypothetical protein [Paraferrimonas sp. SM1919]|uniref:hypothetical protein n=1 Tax=Paraferrimonas sp. SM1919 TaxID=2662263 RepID=UPI0013D0398C|nr:hypothetical protein [Paraferrimonas sp. SM1919]
MEEIIKSVKAYLYERNTSPLFGAFITTWCVWNYKLFLVIFIAKEKTSEDLLKQIDSIFNSHIFPTIPYAWWDQLLGSFWNGLLGPGIITGLYLYVYPKLAEPVYKHALDKQSSLRVIKQEQEKKKLLSLEESQKLLIRLSEIENKNSEETEIYRSQINALTSELATLREAGVTNKDTGVDVKIDKIDPKRFVDVHLITEKFTIPSFQIRLQEKLAFLSGRLLKDDGHKQEILGLIACIKHILLNESIGNGSNIPGITTERTAGILHSLSSMRIIDKGENNRYSLGQKGLALLSDIYKDVDNT